MRHLLIPVLLLGLVAGCSSAKIGPHRIDVQQGNALDQENVARLKTGLNRSQVRFLLGTPLVVDPFRNDRWDYVYVFYKAGKLAEQKRITLFFEGDTLVRMEGDVPEQTAGPVVPANAPSPDPQPAPAVPQAPAAPESRAAEPAAPAPLPPPQPVDSVAPAPAAEPQTGPASAQAQVETSIVAPLPSPKNAPAYVDPRPRAELSLQPETDVARIQPDVIPPYSQTGSAADSSDPVLKSVNEWAGAWTRRDKTAYFAAYDDHFVPQDGSSRVAWEKRKRQMLDTAKHIELRIDSPSLERTEEGTVVVTFNQAFRSGAYHDAVVKQLHMVERDGRWLIVEEKVLSTLREGRP